MPSQLHDNEAVYFICARDFTYNGEDYKMGEKFPSEVATGRIDLLVRTRRVFAVVDDLDDKPRHWHHHIWLRSDISKKLGLINNANVTTIGGSSLYNKPTQMGLEVTSVEAEPVQQSPSEEIDLQMRENITTAAVLAQENSEEEEPTEEEQAAEEPQNVVSEGAEPEEEPAIVKEDLYDPSEHNAPEVVEYLTGDISDAEFDRVVAAERNGKARKGVLDNV